MIHRTYVRISKYFLCVPRRCSVGLQVTKCLHTIANPKPKPKGKHGVLILWMSESLIGTCTCKALTLWLAELPCIRETAAGAFSPSPWELSRKKKKAKPKIEPKTKNPTQYLSASRPLLCLKNFKKTQGIHNLVRECFLGLMGGNYHC